MIESSGNIWEYHLKGYWAVIPTNTCVRSSGVAIMGAGLAADAAKRFSWLPDVYGAHLRRTASPRPFFCESERIILFPTKYHWSQSSSLVLIEDNLYELAKFGYKTAVPLLGCGLGKLVWADVRPLFERILVADNFWVIHPLYKEHERI